MINQIITLLKVTKKVTPTIARAKGAYKHPSSMSEAIKSGKLRAQVQYKPTKRELNNRKSITIKLENNG